MPWKARKPVDERLKFIARLLDGAPMAVLCWELGISRKIGIFEDLDVIANIRAEATRPISDCRGDSPLATS